MPSNISFLGNRVPDDERDDAWHISQQVHDLFRYTNSFRATVVLFWDAHEQAKTDKDNVRLFDEWQFIAARDGTITIFNFAECLQAIKRNCKEHPTINEHIDWNAIRDITREFKTKFPSYDKLRHGVAHTAQTTKDREAQSKHSSTKEFNEMGIRKDGDGEFHLGPSLYNHTFSTMHRGYIRKYDVTAETLNDLRSIRDGLANVFEDLVRNLK